MKGTATWLGSPLLRRQTRQLILTAIAAVLLAMAPGFAQNDGATLVVGAPSGASTLDVHLEPNNTVSDHLQFLEGLIGRNDAGEMEGRLATSWEYIPDEMAFVFHLREGVVFHNGEEFDAEDVKFSIDRIILDLQDQSSEWNKGMRFARETEVLDKYTVKLYLTQDDPLFYLNLSITPIIYPKDYFESVGAAVFAQQPVGTGPYRVVRWRQNQELVLERFEDYWGEQPDIANVTMRVIPDPATLVAELQAGGIDFLPGVPAERATELSNYPGIDVFSSVSTVNLWLDFNVNVEPFGDRRVREAIALGIPTAAIRRAVFGDYATEARTAIHKTSFGHDPDIEPYPYDPDRARQLLAEAGYPNGFSTELIVPPLNLWPNNTGVAVAIAGALSEIGVNVSVNVMEFADFFPVHQAGELDGMFLWGNTSPTLDAFRHMNLNFASKPGLTYRPVPEAAAWIAETGTTDDAERRLELFSQAQQAIKDFVAIVPILEYSNIYALREPFTWSGRADNYFFIKNIEVANSD